MRLRTSPDSPMVITLSHFNRLREHFVKHYFLKDCDPNFGGQEVQVPWNSFSLAVNNFMSANKCEPENVAVRFVLCYDPKGNVLYLRMQILTMQLDQEIADVYNLIDSPCAWYKLANGTIIPTSVTDLFDVEYLSYFYYCNAYECSPETLQNLADDKDAVLYTRTIVYPWQMELQQLFLDNSSPANATLCLDAASANRPENAIEYQHTLAIYLRDQDGTPLLNNREYELAFEKKAGDCGTMCPPTCKTYVVPAGSSSSDH